MVSFLTLERSPSVIEDEGDLFVLRTLSNRVKFRFREEVLVRFEE